MTSLNDIKIELEDPNRPVKHYYSGQKITGRVVLNLETAIEIKEITVSFHGCASVHLNLKPSKKKNVHQCSTENYIDEKIALLSTPSKLTPGKHVYPFEEILPHKLPSSYIKDHPKVSLGMIEYKIEAEATFVQIPDPKSKLSSNSLKTSVPFSVIGTVDLNEQLEVVQRAELYDHRHICCCCCKNGPVEMLIQFSRRGFVAGETISFVGDITNSSRRKIKNSTARLIQRVTFNDYVFEKTISEIVQVVHSDRKILPGKVEIWRGTIVVPESVPISRLGGSRLIDLRYVIEFEMHIAGCTKNLIAEIPIVIGNIPLKKPLADNTSVISFVGSAPASAAYLSRDNSKGDL